MKNIYDIREEKKLYFLLSEEFVMKQFSHFKDVAIIIYLYYEDSLENYMSYVEKIPSEIQIIIVTGNEKIYNKFSNSSFLNKEKIQFLIKENRGRDISALLVTCREICLNYKYICFVHDKKKQYDTPNIEFDLWIENLWGNVLGSEKYITNVLSVLESSKEIGILVPPEPIGVCINEWYVNAWGPNFELTQNLKERLNLCCDLDIKKSPITLGTVFWAKSVALKKIFTWEWKNEDFDAEPLKRDGTISHAIERIFGYVAQDAGYDTGTVMSIYYARKLFSYIQKNFSEIYQLFKSDYGLTNIEEFPSKRNYIYNFCNKNKRIYIYGAGKIGRNCLHLLRAGGYEPIGYIVTNIENQQELKVEGLSVNILDNILDIQEAGIIIAVDKKWQAELEGNMKERNIINYIKYMD